MYDDKEMLHDTKWITRRLKPKNPDNRMVIRQTMGYKTLHRKLKDG